ncbi:MAG: ATP synthase F1 subunit gamma [Candidatus Omnitrophica bacterium]|nr:ATP synthase F1 subunit gamma [Candidatus Omnitrophota bacterium]
MSQQLRQLKSRIRSVEGTWKVTRAMEMVAMSKYKTIEGPLVMARAYFEKLASITYNILSAQEEPLSHPFLSSKNDANGPVGLFIISSDTGLCGAYSDHLLKASDRFILENKARGVKVFAFGRKAANHCKKRGIVPARVFPGIHGKLRSDFYLPVYEQLSQAFLKGEIKELYVAYTIFENAMKHHPVVQKLITIDIPPDVKSSGCIVESGPRGIGADIIPMFVTNRLRLMFFEAFTSEHSARMVAMKSAKDNAKELMGDLILLRNKIRQATITREVIEIISSAEALKG